MADAYYGEIRAFGFNYAPEYWASCDGQQMPVGQNQALFAILGIRYGGDGKNYFNLPNLQGCVPIGAGAGPGLKPRTLGDKPGAATVTVTASQVPPHTHTLKAALPKNYLDLVPAPVAGAWVSIDDKTSPAPVALLKAYSNTSPNTMLSPQSLSPFAGSGGPSANTQPYQVFNFCICTTGEWPPKPD